MKPEHVYNLGPDAVSTEMIDKAKDIISKDGKHHSFEEFKHIAEAFLEVAKDYYRRGAFDMEHCEGLTCMAEDQGGWPCCAHPAEYFVKTEHLEEGEKRRVYCNQHRIFNRFFREDQMALIYKKP